MIDSPPFWRAGAVLWGLLVVSLGLLPTQGWVQAVDAERETAIATAGHFVEYVVLAFVLAVALGGWRARPATMSLAFVLALGLGVSIELVQAPLPYRSCELVDALVDAAGAAAGLAVFSAAAWARGRRRWRRG